jgi:hypothetical protein
MAKVRVNLENLKKKVGKIMITVKSLNVIDIEGFGAGKLAEKLVMDIKNEIVRKGAVASGQLLRSVKAVKKTDDWYRIVIPPNYVKFLEYGTRGNRSKAPPFFAIYRWVLFKLHKTGDEAVSVTYAVMNKIKKRGTKARHIIRDVFLRAFGRI